MLTYPSIPVWKDSRGIGKPCIAYHKYDGSNIRFEWSPKRGWHKFGTRGQLFDHNTPLFNQAIPLFMNTMAEQIVSVVSKQQKSKIERIVAFTEFFGPSSFAGTHDENEPKQLVFIDISLYKKGFMAPRLFLNLFEEFPWTAKVVYEGNMNHEFIEGVRYGQYPVYEGVVCKGENWTAKIKTHEFLNRLKNRFGDEWEKYV